MVTRRDLILGSGMLVAAAGAYALTPRDRLKLLGKRDLAKIVPAKIGGWVEVPSDAFVLPKTEGSLSDLLYSQMLTRLYQSYDNIPVMVVMAYGDLQSDALQLHRPE
ncbi:MAG: exosortase-associated EpsI family protein, partial [Polymorphobacter sp.]